MKKYTKTYSVILDDMDMQQYRLRPISAIMYLQDTFARYCATRGMAAYDLKRKGQYWVISELNMKIVAPLPFWSEEIKAELWFSEISRLKVYADFRLYYHDQVVACGDTLWLMLDSTTKRLVKADEMASKFTVHPELVFNSHSKMVLPVPADKVASIMHIVNLSDIDFNNHVNNKSYLHIAAMALPEAFRETHGLKSLQVRFNKETFLGDSLSCQVSKTQQSDCYLHRIDKGGVSVCDVITTWQELTAGIPIVDYGLEVKKEVVQDVNL